MLPECLPERVEVAGVERRRGGSETEREWRRKGDAEGREKIRKRERI